MALPPIAVTAISPDMVPNDGPADLTLTGLNFVDGIQVAVGAQTLTGVRIKSNTILTGTLASSLCPDTYAATITDPQGRLFSGGRLVVQGKRAVSFTAVVDAASIQLNGRDQRLIVPLLTAQLEDSVCNGPGWQLSISVDRFTHAERRGPGLQARSIRLDAPGVAVPLSVPLSNDARRGVAAATLPGNPGHSRANVSLSVEVDVPANAYAGRYTAAATVALARDP